MKISRIKLPLLICGAGCFALYMIMFGTGLISELGHRGVINAENIGHLNKLHKLLLGGGSALLLLGLAVHFFRGKIDSGPAEFTARLDKTASSQARWILFLVSFLGLFFEVLILRWATTEIRLFSYMKNFALMSCFLGLGLGYALAKKNNYLPLFPIFLSIYCSIIFLASRFGLTNLIPFPQSTEMMWGSTWSGSHLLISYAIFYAALLSLFAANMICFIPLGQVSGALMLKLPPITAYTINIAGSLIGTLAFSLLCHFNLPPFYWFLAGIIPALALLYPCRFYFTAGLLFSALLLATLLLPNGRVFWSPYYRIDIYDLSLNGKSGGNLKIGYGIDVNHDYHQRALDLSNGFVGANALEYPELATTARAYNLPYKFKNAENVLVVGAGMGNDVAAALRNGAKFVRAVEIDPLIVQLGRKYHPEKPYADPRVKVTVSDARTYFENSPERFDLVVFGLLDSHTLFSHFSNLRLDNYIYTEESLTRAKSLLNPGGLLALSYSTGDRESWLFYRLNNMIRDIFGTPPLAINTDYDRGHMFIAGERFDANAARSVAAVPGLRFPEVKSGINPGPATDDWPFLYLKEHTISGAYIGALALVLALALIFILPGFKDLRRFDFHFFFLGAAFLLIEFRSITEMALLFGATWVVNSIVISAVLIMILIANIAASRMKSINFTALYILLFASILAGYLVPPHSLLLGSALARGAAACGILTLPVLFAGMIFAGSIKHITNIDDAFASNLIGAVFGGLAEYATLVYGLKSIYLIALAFYFLSLLAMVARKKHSAA